MKTFGAYAVSATLLVAVATGSIGLLLDEVGRTSLVVAAVVALPVQLIAFGMLVGMRGTGNRFLLAFLGGVALRVMVLGGVGLAVTQMETGLAAAPLVLGLAGYFFALLLLEGFFLQSEAKTE